MIRGLSDEEILGIWESVTDFTEGWHEAIGELLSRADDLKMEIEDPGLRSTLEKIQRKLLKLRQDIDDTVESARSGEISSNDLENFFRDYGETLSSLEAELLELELEPDDYDDYYDEFDEEEY